MNAQIMAFIIWIFCSIVFMGIGIYSFFADRPVRFWTIQDSIRVNNVKKYNHAVAKLWLAASVVFILIGIPILFTKQNSAWIVIPILGAMFWSILLAVCYIKIEKKYRVY